MKVIGKKAIASFLKTERPGDRVVDPEAFVAKCVERRIKDFWNYVRVTIKDAAQLMGKEDMEDLCTRPPVQVEQATLELKDK